MATTERDATSLGALAPAMPADLIVQVPEGMPARELSYQEAIREALREEMRRDETVIVLGEDVGRKGGVFLATDGLWEAENAAGQEFGWKKLIEACERNRRRPLDETLEEVIASAGQWCAPAPFADEVAMLAIECE